MDKFFPFEKKLADQKKFYDQLADTWWDENGILHLLKVMVNPWRVPYFKQLIYQSFGERLQSVQLLDIGSGGGLLTEEYHQMGLQVSGIDISEKSTKVAFSHAQLSGLNIGYIVGSATTLPFSDNSFDIVSCCDVLEHLSNWDLAISETARVLKPNGLFLFDTINRTLFSFIAMILGAEIIPFTRFLVKGTHSWQMFIKPEELVQTCEEHNLICKNISGGKPNSSLVSILGELIKLNQGRITIKEFGEKLSLKSSNNLSANYIGYAVRS